MTFEVFGMILVHGRGLQCCEIPRGEEELLEIIILYEVFCRGF